MTESVQVEKVEENNHRKNSGAEDWSLSLGEYRGQRLDPILSCVYQVQFVMGRKVNMIYIRNLL